MVIPTFSVQPWLWIFQIIRAWLGTKYWNNTWADLRGFYLSLSESSLCKPECWKEVKDLWLPALHTARGRGKGNWMVRKVLRAFWARFFERKVRDLFCRGTQEWGTWTRLFCSLLLVVFQSFQFRIKGDVVAQLFCFTWAFWTLISLTHPTNVPKMSPAPPKSIT